MQVPLKSTGPARSVPNVQQNRAFLDLFWDLSKPDQQVRLKAVENLVLYLKTSTKEDELEYTLKRLVDGLAHTREAARPGFSLALGQLLGAFDDISLQSLLERIQDKHCLQTTNKKLLRSAAFGNLFGVLALHQSGRLSKEPPVVLACVQVLQSLGRHRQQLKDLPSRMLVDILSEVPEAVFEDVLMGALRADLQSALTTPEQLQLLLVALQRFPHALKPNKLKKLLGSSAVVTAGNIPRLVELLKLAACSVKKERVLPTVALDLLRVALKENNFHLFWTDVLVRGLLAEPPGPAHFLTFRLLGASLPLLSSVQLQSVLSGDIMRRYGEHVLSSQKPDRFRVSPEMDAYVSDFLRSSKDEDKHVVVAVGFSSLTHHGAPLLPAAWRLLPLLQPAALQQHVSWLKDMFLQPQLHRMIDVSKQGDAGGHLLSVRQERSVFHLRRWIVSRLMSIVDDQQVKKEEELVVGVARFVFFHAFFSTKTPCIDVPETEGSLSVPLDDGSRAMLVSSFFGLLQTLHRLPPTVAAPPAPRRTPLGLAADGTMWIQHVVRFAQVLLSRPQYVTSRQPFTPPQRHAWDSMLLFVGRLEKKESAENKSFVQLILLLGLHLFKAPEELVDVLKDVQSCVDKAQEKKTKKKKQPSGTTEQQPQWVEVMVDILLSLLSQPSRHIRHICRAVFSSICPHVNAAALAAIIDVLDPDRDGEEDGALTVVDDSEKQRKGRKRQREDDDVETEEDSDKDSDEDDQEVDPSFRLEVMKALQQKNTVATEDDGSEDMDDDVMMELDRGLSTLFSQHKKKVQEKKNEKTKLQREKTLLRDYKIKVLDLVQVFVVRQASSPLVVSLLEPLLSIIDRGTSSEQQEQDFLRRTADIFRNQLCRSKVYYRAAADRSSELHLLLNKMVDRSQRVSDSSVALYYFSASLYLLKVLRGVPAAGNQDEHTPAANLTFMGNVDVDRVSSVFSEALSSFMSRRKSPLTTQMFSDLFSRFPVMCVRLLDTLLQFITSGVREHQQAAACVLLLRAMQSREMQLLLSSGQWVELCVKVTGQLTKCLQQVVAESKVIKDKVVKALELVHVLVRHVQQQKLSVDLQTLQKVLQSLTSVLTFKKTGRLEDTYWTVMRRFGITKPKAEKNLEQEVDMQPVATKKKGFLPETKKRKKRKSLPAGDTADKVEMDGCQGVRKKKLKRPADRATTSQAELVKKSRKQLEDRAEQKKKKNKRGGTGGAGGQT